MSTRTYSTQGETIAVAKKAVWLAWRAAGAPVGMGFLQDNPEADEEAVWANATSRGDYPGSKPDTSGRVSADYVFGRMMKLYFTITDCGIEVPDGTPRADYQAWCRSFPTYAALFDRAERAVDEAALVDEWEKEA